MFPFISYANREEKKVCAYANNVVVWFRVLRERIDRLPEAKYQQAADENDERDEWLMNTRKNANCSYGGQVLTTRCGGQQHAANRLSEKAAEKQNAENHYDSDYDDLDQAHN
jgi:hypothetical protein